MTTGLEKLILAPCYQAPGNKDLLGLFNGFIRGFQTKMSELRFIKLLQACFSQLDAADAVAKIEPFIENWKGVSLQVGQIVKGGWLAKAGKLDEARELLDSHKDEMEGAIG